MTDEDDFLNHAQGEELIPVPSSYEYEEKAAALALAGEQAAATFAVLAVAAALRELRPWFRGY